MNKRWINLLAFIAVLVMNALATFGKINQTTPGSISDQYPITFTPAGYAFSIWSLIYLLLLILFVWSVSDISKFVKATVHQNYYFLLSCVFNIAWLFAWHYKILWLSWIFMVALLVSLTVLNLQITRSEKTSMDWIQKWPFQIYFGWIIVATIANSAILLYSLNFKQLFIGINAEIWTVLLIIIAFLLTWFISFVVRIKPVGWVFIWAVTAIAVKNFQWRSAAADINQFASKWNLMIFIIAFITVFTMLKSFLDDCKWVCCSYDNPAKEVHAGKKELKKAKKK